jgi:hypothetical protein
MEDDEESGKGGQQSGQGGHGQDSRRDKESGGNR